MPVIYIAHSDRLLWSISVMITDMEKPITQKKPALVPLHFADIP